MAGSRTPEGMTTKAIRRLIREAGREPVERDTLYNVITGPDVDLQELPRSVAPWT
jgi:aminodeoxyfutalosine synthase